MPASEVARRRAQRRVGTDGRRARRESEASAAVIRRLQLLVIAAVLVVAAFSTGLPFLFYLVYLAILVVGGSTS